MGKYRSEWKYCIHETALCLIKERLTAVMDRDIYAKQNGKYEIHSLYFDDFQDTCARENAAGDGIRYKYRIRYYNDNPEVLSLEKKSKYNSFCHKQSCPLTLEQYDRIINDDVSTVFWNAQNKLLREFCVEVLSQGFHPKAIVNYEREAFVEPINNVRITFDNAISASDNYEDFIKADYRKIPILPEKMSVLEVKFDELLPAYIRRVVQAEAIHQSSFSKYYLSRIALQSIQKK